MKTALVTDVRCVREDLDRLREMLLPALTFVGPDVAQRFRVVVFQMAAKLLTVENRLECQARSTADEYSAAHDRGPGEAR